MWEAFSFDFTTENLLGVALSLKCYNMVQTTLPAAEVAMSTCLMFAANERVQSECRSGKKHPFLVRLEQLLSTAKDMNTVIV